MSLMKLKQIEGGLLLSKDVADLKSFKSSIAGAIESLRQRTQVVNDTITLAEFTAPNLIKITDEPNENDVEVWINGVRYLENKDFDVNREEKVITWKTTSDIQFSGDNKNIYLDEDEVIVKYFIGGQVVSGVATQRIFHQNNIPTVPTSGVTYEQGDIIFKINITVGSNVGWVCTEGGEIGKWHPFGEVIDEENKPIGTNGAGDIVVG